MEVQTILHMKGGNGETSYGRLSLLQKEVILKAKDMVQESIREVYCRTSYPKCIKVTDMGCSSGPNTFLPTWGILESLNTICHQLNLNSPPPMLQVFLNDLPGNDFNTVFKSLPSFYDQLKDTTFSPCFVAAVPGSFYQRLFPDHSLHLVHSSYSLHWCSEVPKGLVSESGVPLNKGNIYIAKTSPPGVHKAYLEQYEVDFTTFLRSRSEELVPGGRMVLTLIGSSDGNDNSFEKYGPNMWELFGIILNEMVIEGLIEESTLDSFSMPFYSPSAEEARHVIQKEGSFKIHQLETYQLSWDANFDDGKKDSVFDNEARANYVAKRMRAVGESILSSHFGEAIMDDLFDRFTKKVSGYLEIGKGKLTNLVMSLEKEQ